MEVVDIWCSNWIEAGNDVVVYAACHGLKYEGAQWLVSGSASLTIPLAVAMQCVETNWLRIRVAVAQPRITIFALDCCNVEVHFSDGKTGSGVSWRDAVKQHMVDVSKLNSSRAALNVIIFRGAADLTEAKETADKGGDFTNAFIKFMRTPDLNMDQLSQLVRSRLAQKQKVSVIEAETNGITAAEDVQVSPTENYIEFENRSWSFFESETSCCGMMPREWENVLIRIFRDKSTGDDGAGISLLRRASRGTEGDCAETYETREDVHSMMYFDIAKCGTASKETEWQAVKDKEGHIYYYNVQTGVTQRECPEELQALVASVKSTKTSVAEPASYTDSDSGSGTSSGDSDSMIPNKRLSQRTKSFME